VTLLAPLWLALAAAALVPILLHFIRRRSGTTLAFPAVRFLQEAQRDRQRETTLRHLILLLLRVLAVLAIALLAARPLGSPGGTGHAPTALAVVLDNSLRSSAAPAGVPLVDRLAAETTRLLADATADDQVWLVLADGTVHAGLATVRAALESVAPLQGGGDLPAAITRAGALVAGSGRAARHIVVVSDGSAAAFPAPGDADGAPVTLLTPPLPAAPNAALTGVRTSADRWSPWGSLQIEARSTTPRDVRVVLGERTIARGTITPAEVLTLRAQAGGSGWLAGRVELPPDDLRGDDVRHFAVLGADPPAIRVDASAGPFAANAVETLVAAGRARRGDAVHLVAADLLRPGGAALVVAPEAPSRIGAANRALGAAGIPWRFGPPRLDSARVREGVLDGVEVRTRYTLERDDASADAMVIAAVDGTPWIVAGAGYVLVASPLDGRATDLPTRAAFVPWLGAVTQSYLVTDGGPILAAAPGAVVALPRPVDELLAPDGGSRPVTGLSLTAPSAVGVYWLRSQGRTVAGLVVDAEADATDPTPLTQADAIATRAAGAVQQVSAAAAAAARTFATPAPQPLASALFLVLLVLLVLEGWMARPSRHTSS